MLAETLFLFFGAHLIHPVQSTGSLRSYLPCVSTKGGVNIWTGALSLLSTDVKASGIILSQCSLVKGSAHHQDVEPRTVYCSLYSV